MTRTARIIGLGHHAPARTVPNAEIEASLRLEPGWIASRTGIRSRRWAEPSDTLSGMAQKAGDMALAMADLDRAAVGLLLLATSTPDHLLPPSAPLVAHRLGLANAGAVDLAGACAGFVYALTFADAFVRTHGKPALVIAANILSRRINPAERASAVLFADAAGGSSRPFAEDLDVSETRMTIADGRAVFIKAVEMMARGSAEALAAAGLCAEDISRLVPHQANIRIVDAVAGKLGIEDGKVAKTIADYGNSSAATIPLSMSLSHQARPLERGEKLLFAAAGAGLTAGALVAGM